MKFCFVKKDFIEVEENSEKLAVIGEDYSLSWKEFREKVNDLSYYFQHNKVRFTKEKVLIYGHKSADMLVSIYALIKAEIPYIPLDIIYPKARISRIAELAKSTVLINTTCQKLKIKGLQEIFLGPKMENISLEKEQIKADKNDKDAVVYTIFTSGSTGEPKGVQISTEAIQSFSRWMTADFGFTSNDVFINTAPLSFDLSVFEIISFAAVGGTVLLASKETSSNPDLFLERVSSQCGSVLVATPSFMLIYARLKNENRLDNCHTFLFCGEVLPHDLATKLSSTYPNSRILNTYGPTEATVATTLVEIDDAILENYNPLPVGKVKRESELLIEDEEIIIVGPNVSVGYLNNKSLNRKKFSIRANQRAFKTGDKGYLRDGMLFFKGREDDLIKLHGYRIELNEINTALNQLENIKLGAAVALKRNGIVKKIVALVEVNEVMDFNAERVKAEISKKIPIYMVPSDIKLVEKIPFNQNGKLDQKRLSELYLDRN